MTEPPTFFSRVVCIFTSIKVIFKYNIHKKTYQPLTHNI
uniref:Uncharacterized protein n=1 Tax=Klebsiella pneumoniae TaxID=573 RepID=A0A482E5G4_KLEPN|nr:hypothetical protein [Klebsiella pneumoniae]